MKFRVVPYDGSETLLKAQKKIIFLWFDVKSQDYHEQIVIFFSNSEACDYIKQRFG